MLALWVKVRVKPGERERFLKAIEVDAIGSERDEAALEVHRNAPHYAVWRAAADTLDGSPELARCATVFPAGGEYWEKRRSAP